MIYYTKISYQIRKETIRFSNKVKSYIVIIQSFF